MEGNLVIDNEEFKPSLSNPNSTEFKEMASKIENQLLNTLFDQQTLKYGAADISVKVMEFT